MLNNFQKLAEIIGKKEATFVIYRNKESIGLTLGNKDLDDFPEEEYFKLIEEVLTCCDY